MKIQYELWGDTVCGEIRELVDNACDDASYNHYRDCDDIARNTASNCSTMLGRLIEQLTKNGALTASEVSDLITDSHALGAQFVEKE